MVLVIAIPIQRNRQFPLLLGNELTGDRPWKGRIQALWIADKAISRIEVHDVFRSWLPAAMVGHPGTSLSQTPLSNSGIGLTKFPTWFGRANRTKRSRKWGLSRSQELVRQIQRPT
jgi:hypothetical protein